MTYGSGNTVLAQDVADRFWNSYFSGQILAAQSFVNTGAPSETRTYGKYIVTYYYWNREIVPRFSNAPTQARGAQAGRNINAAQFGVGSTITASGVHTACKNECGRFSNFVNSFRWYSQRTLQNYAGNQTIVAYDQTKRRYAVFNEFSAASPGNTIAAGDTISTTEYDTLFNSFAQTYAAQRNAGAHIQYTPYTICHTSCHTSCHRNRGRR